MYPSEESIIQNLKDAGCGSDIIEDFMEDMREDRTSNGIQILREHRRFLLDSLHENQKKIDNLDYLIYQIQK